MENNSTSCFKKLYVDSLSCPRKKEKEKEGKKVEMWHSAFYKTVWKETKKRRESHLPNQLPRPQWQ